MIVRKHRESSVAAGWLGGYQVKATKLQFAAVGGRYKKVKARPVHPQSDKRILQNNAE